MIIGQRNGVLDQMIYANPPVDEVPKSIYPKISEKAVIMFNSLVIGDVTIAEEVFIGFYNLIRADSASPFFIGPRTNIQDFVVVHSHPGQHISVDGKQMAIFIEGEVSILHHAIPHGPLYVGRNTYIGHHVSIYGGTIGRNCVIMHHASISNYVSIGNNRFVSPGQIVERQEEADNLPLVPDQYRGLNGQIVDHYHRLGRAYKQNSNLLLNQFDSSFPSDDD
jgi:carbonic anhydrase